MEDERPLKVALAEWFVKLPEAERPVNRVPARRRVKPARGLRAEMTAIINSTITGEGLADELGDCEWLGLVDGLGEGDSDDDSLPEGLTLGDSLVEGDCEPEGEVDGDSLLLGLMLDDSLGEAL